MTYIPISPKERDAMLETIGVKTLDDLFKDVPAKHRFPELELPPALTEMEAAAELADIAASNENVRGDLISFLGAGAYNHYIPSVVDHILRRGEFYTAYTPYQPEISQGTLQGIFEYQSLMAALTGMDVSNSSHYDGATAAAEAVNMAMAQFRGKRKKVVISPTVHPQYREVIRTYTQGMDLALVGDEAVTDLESGPAGLASLVDNSTLLVIVQYPDFFGRVYDYTELIAKAHAQGALACVVANPMALGLFKTPGEMDADIVVGDGQPLGIPDVVRRPLPWFLHHRRRRMSTKWRAGWSERRSTPRAEGLRADADGARAAYQARARHLQYLHQRGIAGPGCGGLSVGAGEARPATGGAALLSQGALRRPSSSARSTAWDCASASHSSTSSPCVWGDRSEEVNAHLLEHGIIGGYDLGKDYPTLKDHLLMAVTEMNSKEDIDALVDVLKEVDHG